MNVELKKDPHLLLFAALLVVAIAALVGLRVVPWKEALAFLAGALALPGLLGRTSSTDETPRDGDAS